MERLKNVEQFKENVTWAVGRPATQGRRTGYGRYGARRTNNFLIRGKLVPVINILFVVVLLKVYVI